MDLTTFFDTVGEHPELRGVGIDRESHETPGVIVEHVPSGMATRLPVAAVEGAEWPVLEEILLGRRDPVVLQHMTRVVGYYSRIQNWNKSKLGELKDRHRGSYGVPVEAEAEAAVA